VKRHLEFFNTQPRWGVDPRRVGPARGNGGRGGADPRPSVRSMVGSDGVAGGDRDSFSGAPAADGLGGGALLRCSPSPSWGCAPCCCSTTGPPGGFPHGFTAGWRTGGRVVGSSGGAHVRPMTGSCWGDPRRGIRRGLRGRLFVQGGSAFPRAGVRSFSPPPPCTCRRPVPEARLAVEILSFLLFVGVLILWRVSVEREFDILNGSACHARAARSWCHGERFSSEIHGVKDGMEVNGKSIMAC